MNSEDAIVFVGNALVDFAVKCDKSLLDKYGLVMDNQYECTKSQLSLFNDVSSMAGVVKVPGGSAQNSARMSATLAKKCNKFAAHVYMIGSIGDDENGHFLTTSLKSSGVNPLYQISKKGNPTGTTVALVTDGCSRTLVANIAASTDLDISLMSDEKTYKTLLNSEIIFVEGYILTNCSEVAFKLAEFSSTYKKVFSFAISAAFVVEERLEDIKRILPKVDILFGNFSEAKALVKFVCGINPEKLSPEDVITNILMIQAKTVEVPIIQSINQLVIITNGSDPVIVGKRFSDGSVQLQVFAVEPVIVTGDAIGAGDTFAAGVLMSLLKKFSIDEAIATGNKCSSLCLKHTGCFID